MSLASGFTVVHAEEIADRTPFPKAREAPFVKPAALRISTLMGICADGVRWNPQTVQIPKIILREQGVGAWCLCPWLFYSLSPLCLQLEHQRTPLPPGCTSVPHLRPVQDPPPSMKVRALPKSSATILLLGSQNIRSVLIAGTSVVCVCVTQKSSNKPKN